MFSKSQPTHRYRGKVGVMGGLILVALAVVLGLGMAAFFYAGRTIYELLHENKALKEAINNLTQESQIGYAKVLRQEQKEGKTVTHLLFVETDRSDPHKRLLEREFVIEGDVVHFDALIVTFGKQLVMDGRERSLYLWRRVYGEHTAPEQGLAIEAPGYEPKRYADLCAKLSVRDRNLFWEEVWKLSNDPERLKEAGITAIYGNVVYQRLQPGLIYVFKISNTGALYPEVVPDL